MKAVLLLADVVKGHPDGTFTVVRAGIGYVGAEAGKPCALDIGLLVHIVASDREAGTHRAELKVLAPSGAAIAPEGAPAGAKPFESQFDIPPSGGRHFLLVALQLAVAERGKLTIKLLVDGAEHDEVGLVIGDGKPAGK